MKLSSLGNLNIFSKRTGRVVLVENQSRSFFVYSFDKRKILRFDDIYMINWDTILKFEERPTISSLEPSPIVVARDRKCGNTYEDIVQIQPTMFAAVNRRHAIGDKKDDYIIAFFWAGDKDSLLRAVYGDLNAAITAPKPPPNELLINPGRFRYRELLADAEVKGLFPSEYFIWSSIASATGLRLKIFRCDYYFVCSQDESAEFKTWDDCQPVAVAFRTFLGGSAIGDEQFQVP